MLEVIYIDTFYKFTLDKYKVPLFFVILGFNNGQYMYNNKMR